MKRAHVVKAWGRILTGYRPNLSIEITRECPLRCPGCYAYGDTHLGGDVVLRQLADFKGQALVDGVLSLVRRYKPVHLSIVGGEPLVRFRELDEMLPKLLGATSQRDRPELAAAVRRMIEASSSAAIAGALHAMIGRPDSRPLLAKIAVPSLVLCGDEDQLTPPSDSQALHAGIAGSRLVMLPGAGHLSNLEAPGAFSNALNAFIGPLSGGH